MKDANSDDYSVDNKSRQNNKENKKGPRFNGFLPITLIGAALKSLRCTKNYTQYDVAEIVNIKVSAYSHHECGSRIPDLLMLIKYSNLYCININYLIMLACLDLASRREISDTDVFSAFCYGKTISENEAELIRGYSMLSEDGKENLKMFLEAATRLS